MVVTVLLLGGAVVASCRSRNDVPGDASRSSPNLVHTMAEALERRGYSVISHDTWLEHEDSGFTFRPELLDSRSGEDGRFQTTTTIQTSHPVLVPEGTFEYQHAMGENEEDSILKGFDGWVQLDLVVLLAALRQKPETCPTLELRFPAKDGVPARDRRAVLGPVEHTVLPSAQVNDNPEPQEEHPFCSCCLLTNSLDSFESLIESDKFCGIRFYAARDENGVPAADCRVNGEDWEEGARALRDYVKTWPQRGLEVRKQYVVLQDFKKRDSAKLKGAHAEPSHAPESAVGPDSNESVSPPTR